MQHKYQTLYSKLFLLAPLFFLTFIEVNANIINAVSCSAIDVQNAINSANDGDVVSVPSGNCTWSQDIIIPDTKGITLKGAGSGNTIITTGYSIIVNTLPTNCMVRITGFTFIRSNMTTRIYMLGTAQNWRIDNNIFDDANFFGPYTIEVGVKGNESLDSYNYGVVDHNQFINRNYATSIFVNWVRWGTFQFDVVASGDWVWSQPAQRGTAQAVYIEDNIFSGNGQASQVEDTQFGGKVVIRYNTIHNPWMSTHSGCTNGGRNTPWIEIYKNTFTEDANRYTGNMIELRSTSGIVFDNTSVNELQNFNIGVDHERSYRTDCIGAYGGKADGTRPYDENADSTGYRALGQPGWGPPQLNNMGNATFSGVFVWNNFNNSNLSNLFIANNNGNTSSHLQFGRELFNSLNMTIGLIANRPTTCSVTPVRSVYVSTDENPQGATLYICTATNVWTKHWEPYTYPHPLVNANPCDTPLGVTSNSGTNINVIAYPNPFNDQTTINLTEIIKMFSGDLNLCIFDILGQELYKVENISTDNVIVSANQFSKGIYIFKISTNGRTLSTGKLIVQ